MKRGRIRKRSRARATQAREQAKLRAKLVKQRGRACQLQIRNVCTGTEQGLAHLKKQSQGGSDSPENCLLGCNACNGWCEDHPAEARALGYVIYSWEPDPSEARAA